MIRRLLPEQSLQVIILNQCHLLTLLPLAYPIMFINSSLDLPIIFSSTARGVNTRDEICSADFRGCEDRYATHFESANISLRGIVTYCICVRKPPAVECEYLSDWLMSDGEWRMENFPQMWRKEHILRAVV